MSRYGSHASRGLFFTRKARENIRRGHFKMADEMYGEAIIAYQDAIGSMPTSQEHSRRAKRLRSVIASLREARKVAQRKGMKSRYDRDPRRKKRAKKGYPQKRCRSSVVTQSVVFDKKHWKSRKALAWLKKHRFKSGKADITKASLRYRQLPPSYVKVVGSKPIKKGVRLILGCPKRGEKKRRDPGGLPNGLAKRAGKRPSDFNRRELLRGTHVEMEHTTSRRIARQIAMDHLTEDPHYYRHKTSRDTRREKLRWRMQRSDGPFRIEIHYKRGGKRTLPRLYTNRALADRVARRWMGRLERFPDVRRVEVVTVR